MLGSALKNLPCPFRFIVLLSALMLPRQSGSLLPPIPALQDHMPMYAVVASVFPVFAILVLIVSASVHVLIAATIARLPDCSSVVICPIASVSGSGSVMSNTVISSGLLLKLPPVSARSLWLSGDSACLGSHGIFQSSGFASWSNMSNLRSPNATLLAHCVLLSFVSTSVQHLKC